MPSMVVLVLHDLSHFDEVIAAWREAGAPAVTIIDSVGTRELDEHARRDDLPLMPTLRDLLQSEEAPRKTVFSVVRDRAVEAIIQRTEQILGDMSEPHKGLLFVLPVSRAHGMPQ